MAIGVFCVTLFASFVILAQQATTTVVSIRVCDPTGAGIPHAQLRLVPSSDKAPEKLETDEHGQLSINLNTGGYALFVSALGFRNVSQHIEISIPEGQVSTSLIVPVVLQVAHGGGPTIYPTAVKGSLMLTADPYHAPVVFSPTEFRALPHITITVHNGHTDTSEIYSGVPLASLLAQVNAPLGKDLRGKAMTNYIIATGSDGYSVVFSLAEVDPGFHEGQVLVADMRNGQPLANSGPFQLIVSDDKRPARWVHNLESITLQAAR